VCYKRFPKFITLTDCIDADFEDDELPNRVICPYCKSEFNCEIPLILYSWKYKTYVAAACPDDFFSSHDLRNALRISGANNITLRKTDYAIEAYEKIHIAKYNLNDAKVEVFKLTYIPEYKDMKNDEETILFERTENDIMIFSHCYFTGEILKEYKIPLSKYENLNFDIPDIPNGKWFKIDKAWALKLLEVKNEF
jgi:hypothetical protein